MLALASWVVLLSGWPRRLVALVTGAVGALAMAPLDIVPAMVVSMTAAIWLIDGAARGGARTGFARVVDWRSCRAAAGVGWWWGLGYFVAGFWWLGAACLVEPQRDAWALPFAVLGVPAFLAFFPAFGFGLARLLWSADAARVLALAAGLGLSEWLRSWLFTGFPWNNYGMAFGDVLILAQFASVVGNDGLTLLVITLCALPATLAGSAGGWPRLAPTLLGVLVILGLVSFGWVRLSSTAAGDVPGVRLRIVQPNVAEDDSFSFANKDKILADYLALSTGSTPPDPAGLAGITHLVWPESAFPFILARDPDALESIGKALALETTLITGAARIEGRARGEGDETPNYFNAIQVVGAGGTILDSYDKVHLVPFGEYLPFDHVLRRLGLTHFVHIPGGFTPGGRRRLLDVPGLPPTAPVICYEAIFSGAVISAGSRGGSGQAGVLLNVTNDGWFGRTSGPYQHFAQARLRAIEEGVPLVRAANSGISAIVDPYGRIRSSLPLGSRGVLDGALPRKISTTIFARTNPYLKLFSYLIVFAGAVALRRRRKQPDLVSVATRR